MRSAVPRLRAAAMSSNKVLQLLGGDGSGSLAAATPGFAPLPPPSRAVAALRAIGAEGGHAAAALDGAVGTPPPPFGYLAQCLASHAVVYRIGRRCKRCVFAASRMRLY